MEGDKDKRAREGGRQQKLERQIGRDWTIVI